MESVSLSRPHGVVDLLSALGNFGLVFSTVYCSPVHLILASSPLEIIHELFELYLAFLQKPCFSGI